MKIPPHYLIIIPGFMGSKLRKKSSGEVVWLDFSSLPINPFQWHTWLEQYFRQLAYPNDDIEAFQLMNELFIASPWVKQEHYEQLFSALRKMGYQLEGSEKEKNVYTFPYDWRQDNRISAQQLGEAIQRWQSFHPHSKAWIIAHSNGGNVARWYIEQLGGKDYVERLFLLGTPIQGSPKALQVYLEGLDTLLRRRFSLFGLPELTQNALRSFPSIYQLFPTTQPFLFDDNNHPINILEDEGWLPQGIQEKEQAINLLQSAVLFHNTLGEKNSIETLCIVGRKHPTTNLGIVSLGAQRLWQKVKWIQHEAGDGTVPLRSAILPSAQRIYPFSVSHGDLYANSAILSLLSWELYEKFSLAKGAEFTQPQFDISFDVQPQISAPNGAIHFSVSINQRIFTACTSSENLNFEEQSTPQLDAQVQIQMVWYQALPGSSPNLRDLKPLSCRLYPQENNTYTGMIHAPSIEGLYTIKGLVTIPNHPHIFVRESIIVENE